MTATPHSQLCHRQRGAFSILTAFTLIVLLLFLVLVIDSGRLYMEQRNLQKLADTAALESVSRLPQGHCAAAPDDAQRFAEENARRNHFLQDLAAQSLTSQCVALHTHNGLRQATPDPQGMAVQVTVGQLVSTSLIRRLAGLISRDIPEHVSLQAVAVAVREEPTAVFSIGSQLLRLDNSRLLGQLLRAVGVNVNHLTLLDSQGLADTQVTPAGLLQQLGVDIGIHQLKALSPQGLVDLVDTEVGLLGLDELVAVSLELVSDSVLQAELQALRQEILTNPILRDMEVRLLGTDDDPGLLSLTSSPDANSGSALEAGINLGELLGVALLTGTRERGLVIPDLNVLGLAQVELGVVEPPSIGIGPVGTKAYNAQIRLYIGVDTNQMLGGSLAWLLNNVLGTRVNLPIWIDLVSGDATLEAIRCEQDTPTADIMVETDILNACVGVVPDELKWSTQNSCEASLANAELIRLLHVPVLTGKTHLPALRHDELLTGLEVGETVSTEPNPLALGNSVSDLVSGLLDLLSGLFRQPSSDLGNHPDLDYTTAAQNTLINNLAKQYLEASKVNGFYNVPTAVDLVLNGSAEHDAQGNQLLPPLVSGDWWLEKSIPTSCLLVVCPQSQWHDGSFTQAFQAYVEPHGLLDLLGISTLSNGYQACGGLLSALLAWNSCLEHNLSKFLRDKPGGISLSQTQDGNSLANPGITSVNCSGFLCWALKPVLELLKPIFNGVGQLLNQVITDALGLELGRSDVTLHSLSCGAPQLVR